MSAPNPLSTLTHVNWPEVFAPAELDAIVALGESLTPSKAFIQDTEELKKLHRLRNTEVAWITLTDQSKWIYERMGELVRVVNGRFYQFDLRGFSDPFQFTIYRSADGGHYDWHVDQGPTSVQRKLSFTLQLSDASDYEGGDLELRAGNQPETATRARGTLIAFPSYMLHRVTPVTSGTRKSLVFWTSGPKFK